MVYIIFIYSNIYTYKFMCIFVYIYNNIMYSKKWIKYITNEIYRKRKYKLIFWLNDKNNIYNNLDDIYNNINGQYI
jgi:hypothetical protein